MVVTAKDVRTAVEEVGIAGFPVCLHSSLRSFGPSAGGPRTVVDGFLDAGCTLLLPTFTGWYRAQPPPGRRLERNGYDYDRWESWWVSDRPYTSDTTECGEEMGAIARFVAAMPDRNRGEHPRCSFCSVGPRAAKLVEGQTPMRPYRIFENLVDGDGWVVLAGVGLDRMTLLHHAEERAGRELFRRWTPGPDGRPVECKIGGCSAGFENLASSLTSVERQARVGESAWRAFPAGDALHVAAGAIRADPGITHCGEDCPRCDDAVAGGPIV